MDPTAACRYAELVDEVARVGRLPTRTKRQMKASKDRKRILRRRIIEFARVTLQGESLREIAQALLLQLRQQMQEMQAEELRKAA